MAGRSQINKTTISMCLVFVFIFAFPDPEPAVNDTDCTRDNADILGLFGRAFALGHCVIGLNNLLIADADDIHQGNNDNDDCTVDRFGFNWILVHNQFPTIEG